MVQENKNWKKAPKQKITLKKVAVNLTVDVLDFFLGIPEALIYGFDKKEFYRYLHGYYHEREMTVENISKWLHNLKKSGYIELIECEGQKSVRFTNKARLAIVDRLAERINTENQYYLVSFDIPEKKSWQRNQFRRVLKRLGFRQVQKSLWVINKNCGELVELAASEYHVSDYVVYAVVNSI